MQDLPICSQCGQGEEFLVSETGSYLCICGHRFEAITLEANNDKAKHLTLREANHSTDHESHQHRSPYTPLH